MLKTVLTILLSASLLFTFLTVTYARSSAVIFVKGVSKRCKHLGSVSYSFEGEKLYNQRQGYKVVPAGPVFADAMKAKARKMGANRLVLVEVFNDKTIMSGMGHHETIDKTEFRARAFKC